MILKQFVLQNMPNVGDYKLYTDHCIKNGLIDSDDEIIYAIPSRKKMSNTLLYSNSKLVVGNRGNWDGDLSYNYKEFITFKYVQYKFLFKKLDISVKPELGWEFFVNRDYAGPFKAIQATILQMYFQELYNENTNWNEVFSF